MTDTIKVPSNRNFSNFCCKKCWKMLYIDVFLSYKDNDEGYENIAMVKVQCDCKDKYSEEYTVKEFLNIQNTITGCCAWHQPNEEDKEDIKQEENNTDKYNTEYFCLNCQEWLCSYCLALHNKGIGEKKHKIIKNYKFNMQTSCVYHYHKDAVYFCKDCHENICTICTRAFKEHRYHQVQLLHINDKVLNAIEKELQKVKEKVEKENDQIKREFMVCLENDLEQNEKDTYDKMYNKNKECNKDIIAIYQNILDFYNEFKDVPNYQGVSNLINNFQYEYDPSKNKIEVRAFLNNQINISKIKEEKDKTNFQIFCFESILLKYERNVVDEILFDYERVKNKKISRTKRFILLKTFNNNLDLVPGSLMVLKDGSIASCTYDNSIKIFTLESMENPNNFKESTSIQINKLESKKDSTTMANEKEGGFYYFTQLPNDLIVTCQTQKDNRNKISFFTKIGNTYEKTTGYKLIENYEAQKTYITKIIPLNKGGDFIGIAMSAWDKTINIYIKENKENFVFKRKLKGHNYAVNSIIQLRKNLILSGSAVMDKTLKVWDISNLNKEIQAKVTIDNIECADQNSLYLVENEQSKEINIENYRYIAVGGNKVVKLFSWEKFMSSLENNEVPKAITVDTPFKGMVKSFLLLNDKRSLLCGCGKDGIFGHFFIIDIKKENPVVTLKFEHIHEDMVSSLECLNNRYLLSSGETIKLWEIIDEKDE